MLSESALDAWVAERWPDGTRFRRDVLRELYEDEVRRRAQEYAASAAGLEIAELRRRLATIERLFIGPDGGVSDLIPHAIAGALREALRDERRRTEERVGLLDAKLAKLEAGQLRFCGVHEPGRSYRANSLTVRRGGLWVATVDTTATPGGGADWQLAVKSGEAAKGPTVV